MSMKSLPVPDFAASDWLKRGVGVGDSRKKVEKRDWCWAALFRLLSFFSANLEIWQPAFDRRDWFGSSRKKKYETEKERPFLPLRLVSWFSVDINVLARHHLILEQE